MFYLAVDQHARQITISLRDEQSDVVQARRVSTQPEKIQEFFERLRQDYLRDGELFLAVVEVCGFNDWLLEALALLAALMFDPTAPRLTNPKPLRHRAGLPTRITRRQYLAAKLFRIRLDGIHPGCRHSTNPPNFAIEPRGMRSSVS